MAHSSTRRLLWVQKIVDEIEVALTDAIQSGAAQPGKKLGTASDLARDFITTASVSECALNHMTEEGWLLEERGTYRVAESQSTGAALTLPNAADATLADILSILELRVGVETVAAAHAAERRTQDDLATIDAAAKSHAEAASTGTLTAQADFCFHRAIAMASGNSYILELLDTLDPLLIPRMRVAMPHSGAGPDKSLLQSLDEHSEIVAAIAKQDEAGARDAMRVHLLRTIDLMRDLGAQS